MVSGRKPSCPRAAAALATAGGAAAMTTDTHTATPAASAIWHRTPRGRDLPAGGREREHPLSVAAMDIVCLLPSWRHGECGRIITHPPARDPPRLAPNISPDSEEYAPSCAALNIESGQTPHGRNHFEDIQKRSFRPLNRRVFGRDFESTRGWSHVSTEEVPGWVE